MIEVLDPGLLTTVQDLGRPGLGRLGVPVSGAADPWSLAVANALVGNAPDAAGLEVTAEGCRLRALTRLTVALAGADLRARVGGTPLRPGRAVTLDEGDELHLPGPPAQGLRAFVALAGGIDVPMVLAARATHPGGGFGGLEGRALLAGDRLRLMPDGSALGADAAWPGEPIAPRQRDKAGHTVLRVVPGLADDAAAAGLTATPWRIAPASDRMGLRLEPEAPLRHGAMAAPATALPSHGVVPGTIQLPPDGRPIVLGVDHQTTGGYPVAGVVITADLSALGQLAPGDTVRLQSVTTEAARLALRAQRQAWDEALTALRRGAGWDALWQSAGA